MIMGIIFSAIEVIGIIMMIVTLIVAATSSPYARAVGSGYSSQLPWYVYVMLFFLFVGKVMQFFSFITGYTPARGGSPAPSAMPVSTGSGYHY